MSRVHDERSFFETYGRRRPSPCIYIAGGSTEREMIARYIKEIAHHGWRVTHNWTASENYGRPSTEEEREEYATLDLLGVARADVVWLVVPVKPSEGQAVELGYALALHKPVVASGAGVGRSVFHMKVPTRFESHSDAWAWILGSGYVSAPSNYCGGYGARAEG